MAMTTRTMVFAVILVVLAAGSAFGVAMGVHSATAKSKPHITPCYGIALYGRCTPG
jgi:hypothetical protein